MDHRQYVYIKFILKLISNQIKKIHKLPFVFLLLIKII